MSERRAADLSKLSDGHLRSLRDAIEAELARRARTRQRGERARGGLLEGHAPLYRNPENPSETWSGRGTPPRWVEEMRARGVRLDDLRTDDDRPVPTRGRSRRR